MSSTIQQVSLESLNNEMLFYKSCEFSGIIAEWVEASALSHSEWVVKSSNASECRNYFYSRVGDAGLSVTHIDGYIVAIT